MSSTLTDYRATCAYWYAVGHADGTGEIDVAEEFRAFHRAQAEAYYTGRVSSLPSIPDAWQAFSVPVTPPCQDQTITASPNKENQQ